eukprot:scaffold48070_cov34-Tisochrysis_lutea.AAC.3
MDGPTAGALGVTSTRPDHKSRRVVDANAVERFLLLFRRGGWRGSHTCHRDTDGMSAERRTMVMPNLCHQLSLAVVLETRFGRFEDGGTPSWRIIILGRVCASAWCGHGAGQWHAARTLRQKSGRGLALHSTLRMCVVGARARRVLSLHGGRHYATGRCAAKEARASSDRPIEGFAGCG